MASEIWTEKYRPSKFSEIVGQDNTVKKVESLTNSLNIPHLLFAGPAGTGKSSMALIIVKELFGKYWHENYLELNASDERGINVVREKVKKRIAEGEKLTINPDALELIYEGSEGDCRRMINILQSTASISPLINYDLVSTIISNAKPKDIRVVLDYAISGDFQKAREKLLDIMLRESISGQDVIKAIQKEIWNLPVEPEVKVKLTEKTGESEFRIVEGSDPFIQLQSLLASFVLAGLGL